MVSVKSGGKLQVICAKRKWRTRIVEVVTNRGSFMFRFNTQESAARFLHTMADHESPVVDTSTLDHDGWMVKLSSGFKQNWGRGVS